MFSFRKPSALIVSGLLLLQMVGTASAATPTQAVPQSAKATSLVKFTPSKELATQLMNIRAAKSSLDALKANRDQKLKRGGGNYVPGDGASQPAKIYGADEIVRVIVSVNGQSVAEQAAAHGQHIQSMDTAAASDAAQSSAAARASVLSAASSAGLNLQVRHTYDVALSGFSAEMRYGDMAQLAKVAGVKKVSVAQEYQPLDNFSTGTIGASDLWGRTPAVDGAGQVIAIIDTGVDYRHPDLGNQTALDANGKVIGGWNFADDSAQVLDYSGSGHGTHVAGIAAATGDGPQHIKGVAPKAKIIAQKVFSNDINVKSAWTDDLVAAIDDAVDASSAHHPGVVANVMNMSLGSVSGFADPTDPEQVAIANAAGAGAVVAMSAGNSSYNSSSIYNPYYWNQDIATVGSPGTAPEAITVASSQNNKVTVEGRGLVAKINGAAYTGGHYTVYLDSSSPFGAFQTMGATSLPLAIPGTTGDQRGCNASDWNGVDLTGKVALIKRGTCTFQVKTDTAAAAGAKAVVIFNQNADPDITSMAVDAATIPSVMVMNSYGSDLQAALKAAKQVKVTFNGQDQRLQLDDPKGDTMSSFSSWGTTPQLGFKPDLTAPGGNIYSTVPNGQYEIMNGTSMAAPHVAGAAALVMEAHPDFAPADVKAALMNTAKVLKPTATAKPYSPRQQGAGRIQVDKAIDTKVVVTAGSTRTPSLTLGAVQPGSVTPFTLTVKNTGPAPAAFTLSSSVYRPGSSGDFNTLSSVDLTGAVMTFVGGSNITVPAGQSLTVSGTLDLTNAVAPVMAHYGYFAEGFITLKSNTTGQPDLTVPHMSYVGQWVGANAQPIVDPMTDNADCYTCMTGLYTPGSKAGSFLGLGYGIDGTFNRNNVAIGPQQPLSTAITFLRNAQSVQIDVIDQAGKQVDRIGSDAYLRNLAAAEYYLGNYWQWDGQTYDRSTGTRHPVADGQYQVRVRALSPSANPDTDWQTYLMPVKMDSVAPGMNLAADRFPNVPGPLTFTWADAADNAGGSGLYGVVPILDGKVLDKQWSKPTASGSVTVDIAPGNHTGVGICAVDNAGNVVCYQFPPFASNAISAVGPTDIQSNKDNVTVAYTAGGNVQQITYQEGASEAVKVANTGSIALHLGKDGKHTVVVRGYADEAATTLLGEVTYTIDLDMTPPIIHLTSPDFRKPMANGELTVKGSVTEAHPKAEGGVQWSIDGAPFAPVTLDSNGAFEFPISLTGDGRHNLKFITEDAAPFNNHGEMGRAIIIGASGSGISTSLDSMGPSSDTNVNVSGHGDYTLTGTTDNTTSNYTFKINGEVQYSTAVNDPYVPRDWSYKVSDIGTTPVVVTLETKDEAGLTTTRRITFTPATGTPVVTVGPNNVFTKDSATLVYGDTSIPGSVSVNGQSVTVDANGHYETVVPVTEGKNQIQVQASFMGTVGLAYTTVTKDTAAPVIKVTAPANGSFLKGAVTVTGTVTDANLDVVTVAGNPATLNADGSFSANYVPAGPDGEHQYVVQAFDLAGNTASTTITYTLDNTAPTLTIAALPAGLQPETITVTGKEFDVNFDSLTVNGTAVKPAIDGTFSTDVKFTTDGAHDITVVATDRAGNTTTFNGTVTVDATAPVVTITGPAGGAYLNKAGVSITGTVSESNLASVTVNDQVVTLIEGAFKVDLTQAEGSYTATVVATDLVGHKTTKTVQYTVDTTAPVITITSPVDGGGASNPAKVTGTVTDANVAGVTVNGVAATVSADGSFTATAPTTNGNITVVATDKAGNTAEKSITVTTSDVLKALTINPTGTWSPAGGNLKISYELAAAGKITLAVYQDGKLKTTLINTTTKQKGTNTFDWNGKIGSRVIDGTYEIRLTAGSASLSQTTTIYATAPAKPEVHTDFPFSFGPFYANKGYTAGNFAVFGTADGATQVVVSFQGPSKIDPVTMNVGSMAYLGAKVAFRPNASFGETIDITGKDGLYTVTVVAKDEYGNVSAPYKFQVTKDSVKPKKPTVTVTPTYVTGTRKDVRIQVRTSEPGLLLIQPAMMMGQQDINLQSLGTVHPAAGSVPGLPWNVIISEMSTTSGTFTMQLPADLPDGTYHFLAAAFDRAGNLPGDNSNLESEVTLFDVIVDRTAPDQAQITSADTAAKGSTYQLTGIATDATSGVDYVLVNGTKVKVDADGNFTYTKKLPTTAGAKVTFTVIVVDKAGNRSQKIDFTVTAVAPAP